jgi:translation initiation factor IF-1
MWQGTAIVTQVLAASNFRCCLTENGHQLLARCNSKMSSSKVMLSVGDVVLIETPAYSGELNRGRILYRYS